MKCIRGAQKNIQSKENKKRSSFIVSRQLESSFRFCGLPEVWLDAHLRSMEPHEKKQEEKEKFRKTTVLSISKQKSNT
ncbi:hypothetical protein TNCV_5103831 [Trichonephila clavipes]|nr:hypothetical protein TNCV_5103831 [Trichonephila clavipes]